ncbi:MAG: protein kinase [Deltaproteobacteria bacterium]|nr:protein kinase [Deltaproteobacteria bacterium]
MPSTLKTRRDISAKNGGEIIADRYLIQKTLGRGGIAVVYRVIDTATKKNVALKKLQKRETGEKQKHLVELFEHEYLTLAQLAHPRVVEVYDFGIADEAPYYTMELLGGGDLRELSPLPWQTACSLFCDVCSALSLLHSRRLIHRDITPRNVRSTKDSLAKLMDFGAMGPMGTCKQPIGTPPFTAPEVLALQPLDAQTDLYSLGATLYYALTGRIAYPARSFKELRRSWRNLPGPPSNFFDSIPRSLDELVMSLISLDPAARPISAAEVIERLSAIASVRLDEHLLVSQAYLLKPRLFGRDEQLLKFRKMASRTLCGSGGTLVIEGASGTGRSRFLDACVLESKLAGATILRADATDAQTGNWGVMNTITAQLLTALPVIAMEAAKPYLPVLGHILPEIVTRYPKSGFSTRTLEPGEERPHTEVSSIAGRGRHRSRKDPLSPRSAEAPPGRRSDRRRETASRPEIVLEEFSDPQEMRPRVQAALCEWLLKVSDERSLVMSIDDFQGIDEPSAACIALLANQNSSKKLMLVVTVDLDAPPTAATALLRSASFSLKLRNLSAESTLELVTSVFGDHTQARLLSDRLYKISDGNPKAVIQVAQHLVDTKVIQYRAGTWTLPHQIDAGEIPGSFAEALKEKLDRLSGEALRLGQTLALCPGTSFSFEECSTLLAGSNKGRVLEVLTELQACGVICSDGRSYALSHQGWASALLQAIGEASERAAHLGLAEILMKREAPACRATRHFFAAGQEQRGLDLLVNDAVSNREKIERNAKAYSDFVTSLPNEWLAVYEQALEICRRSGRPRKEIYILQMMITRIGDHMGIGNTSHVIEVAEQLVRDSGLDIYRRLDDSIEPEKRLWRALELAQKRYDSTPERDRVLSPAESVADLARITSAAIGISAAAYNFDLLEAMPSLEPLAPLSPALGLINNSMRAVQYSNSGHLELSARGLREIVERLSQPDRAGLDETIHEYTDLGHRWGLGLLEASFGIKSAIAWADAIEKHPLHRVNAWCVRMVYHLRQGDIEQAEASKKKMELLQIQNNPTQFYQGTYQYAELTVYILAEDLIRVQRIIPGLQAMAERFATWKPILHLARGEYQRIRGDYRCALAELEQGLALVTAGRHLVWSMLVSSYLNTLFDLKRLPEARAIGEKELRIAEQIGLKFYATPIRLSLALIQAALGDSEQAVENSQAVIDTYLALGTTGVALGIAYETRAGVAILLKDDPSFRTFSRLCAEQYKAGNYPALVAKYDKLMHQARQAGLALEDDAENQARIETKLQKKYSDIVCSVMTDCKGREERAQRALELLVNASNSAGGYLYLVRQGGPELCARVGNQPPPAQMDTSARSYIEAECGQMGNATVTVADLIEHTSEEVVWSGSRDETFQPVLIGHNSEEGYAITGLAVLRIDPDREFNLPAEAIIAMSKSFLESGDAVTLP